MSDIAVANMKEYLGLNKDYKATFNSMYTVASRLEKMTLNDQKPTLLGLIYWLDIYGDFTEGKDVYSKIVNEIFINMGDDMTILFPFIELCKNNYVEEK